MAKGNVKTKGNRTSKQRDSTNRTSIRQTDTDGDQQRPPEATAPAALQQTCLNIFRDTLHPGPDDAVLLHKIKGHLFDRDFQAAFSTEDQLRVYTSRWSPSRALGYLQILRQVEHHLGQSLQESSVGDDDDVWRLNVTCLGGASAELVALAGWLHSSSVSQRPDGAVIDRPLQLSAALIDIADWGSIVSRLHQAVTTQPELSKYASAAAREANRPLVDPVAFHATFERHDLLDLADQQAETIFQGSDMVTVMFTLNELYSASLVKTQRLLAQLTRFLPPSALLLVVDSPGSYSTVSINGAGKNYPIHWLLDHALIGAKGQRRRGDRAEPQWTKVVEDESRWFRLPDGLHFPIELENMRYQIHLYKLVGPRDG